MTTCIIVAALVLAQIVFVAAFFIFDAFETWQSRRRYQAIVSGRKN